MFRAGVAALGRRPCPINSDRPLHDHDLSRELYRRFPIPLHRLKTHQRSSLALQFAEVWNDILANRHRYKVGPKSITFAISTFSATNHDKRAWQVLQWARRQGIEPRVHFYNSLLAGYAHRGDVPGLARTRVAMHKSKVAPDGRTFILLAEGIAKSKKGTFRKDGVRLLAEVKSRGLKATALLYSFFLLMSTSFDEADEILQSMREEGIAMQPSHHIRLLQLARKIRSPEKAEEVFQRFALDSPPLPSSAYNLLAACYAACDDKQGVISVFRRMDDAGVRRDLPSYTTLLASLNTPVLADWLLERAVEEGHGGEVDIWYQAVSTLGSQGDAPAIEKALGESFAHRACNQPMLEQYYETCKAYVDPQGLFGERVASQEDLARWHDMPIPPPRDGDTVPGASKGELSVP